MIAKSVIESVRANANLYDVLCHLVHDFKKEGKSERGTCPKCNSPKKKFYYFKSSAKMGEGYKCHSCDTVGSDAINFLMDCGNYEFIEAVKLAADISNIFIEEVEKPVKKKSTTENKTSFLEEQMKESGIPLDSIEIKHRVNAAEHIIFKEFYSGSKDKFGNHIAGDDMIVSFYDLDYNPCAFKRKASDKEQTFFRVRFKNPALHTDKNGNSMKYWQPYGSGVHIFIPEEVRKMYHAGEKIETLHFEEGEKKAKKKSLHGMPAIGFMGIASIVSNEQLPVDIIRILEKCNVENVIFNLDSDWQEIKVKPNVPIDQRPKMFYSAILKFQNYFNALTNQQIYLKIYVSSILEKYDQKGSDDLLNGVLSGKEPDLKTDFEKSIIDANGNGKYIKLYNVTDLHEYKIKELLHINKAESLARKHKELLKDLPKFKIGRQEYRFNKDDEFELAQPLLDRDKFWKVKTLTKNGNDYSIYEFKYVGLNNFLTSRGFGMYYFGGKANYIFTHFKNNIVTEVTPDQIRLFVNQFIVETGLDEDILEMVYKGGDQYLSARKFYNLGFRTYNFKTPIDKEQYLYFNKKNSDGDFHTAWRITEKEIKEVPFTSLDHNVWEDKINTADTEVINSKLFIVGENGDELSIKFNEGSNKCDFLRFLSLTSIFNNETEKKEYRQLTWKQKLDRLDKEERLEHDMHLLAKITAIGYLLHDYRDGSVLKAVVGMDGTQSEVGESQGRSGKSLVGMVLNEIIPTVIENGKKARIQEDRHLMSEVDDRTRLVFFDDCTVNFPFEIFFPAITGLIKINKKGKDQFSIDINKSPKFYFTTNHAFNGIGGSFEDRQHIIVFSDYFNSDYKPIDEFDTLFIQDWDKLQWNYTYNFLAQCVQTYFIYKDRYNGPIPAPMQDVKLRKLRQLMGEEFLAWANEYFDAEQNLNARLARHEMHKACEERCTKLRRFLTAPSFKKRILAFCDYKGLIFNPHKEKTDSKGRIKAPSGGDDKAGGVEYFTVSGRTGKKDNSTPF